jgi:hypothetical protein
MFECPRKPRDDKNASPHADVKPEKGAGKGGKGGKKGRK